MQFEVNHGRANVFTMINISKTSILSTIKSLEKPKLLFKVQCAYNSEVKEFGPYNSQINTK